MIPGMGYELHVTRASHWSDSEDRPITFQEWIAFAHTSAALREEGRLAAHGVASRPVFTWGGPGRGAVGCHWSEGQVTLSGAHAPGVDLIGLADLAAELSAKLLGDDGERYTGSHDGGNGGH